MDTNAARIDSLASLLRSKPEYVVPFIGAGCSVPFGSPTWSGLLQHLLAGARSEGKIRRQGEREIERLIRRGKVLEAGTRILSTLGGKESATFALLLDSVNQRVVDPPDDAVLYRLPQLRSRLLVTTNYDSRVEDYWWAVRNTPRLRVSTVLTREMLDPTTSRAWLVKLHGDAEQPPSVVLSRKDYDDLLARPRHADLMTMLCGTRTLLFLGYGVSDPDLEYVLQTIKIRAGPGGSHFALLPRSASSRSSELEHLGVAPIYYESTGDQGQDALQLFRDILERAWPGLRSVHTRKRHPTGGVVAWIDEQYQHGIMVDTYGNVVPMELGRAALPLDVPDGFERALEYAGEKLWLAEVWVEREQARWRVRGLYPGKAELVVDLADYATRIGAANAAVRMIPQQVPGGPLANFEYRYADVGTVVTATMEGVEGKYQYFLPKDSPGRIHPLGRGEAEPVLRLLADHADEFRSAMNPFRRGELGADAPGDTG